MPIYEYVCLACDHEFERIQSINEAAVKKCPHCGKSRAQKKVSRGAFQLKGSGWYADGYSKDKAKAATPKTETAAPAVTPAAVPAPTKTESKS